MLKSPGIIKTLSHLPRPWTGRASRPRALILGNHSRYHCGSAAVWDQLHIVAWANGWQPTQSKRDFDALIVNGEGSMHHSSPHFRTKMGWLKDAIEAGKPAYLVNSVWQENTNEFDDVLRKLSGITVREVLSQEDLLRRHGIRSRVVPDLSAYAPVSWRPPSKNIQGQEVATDFYLEASRNWADADYTKRMYRARMRHTSWSRFVATLKTASILITGRQHAVYAACVAGIPFAAVESNTHKITGIVRSAKADIPVAPTISEISDVHQNVIRNLDEFDKIRNWLAQASPYQALPRAAGNETST